MKKRGRITNQVRSYAVRRVNPFLGVLQIIETAAGRAMSTNGVVWDIEVEAEAPTGWGSLNKTQTGRMFYRYGLWSLQDGLVNRPLSPHLVQDPLTRQCHQLIECIRERLDQLPFPLEDRQELWLFDQHDEQPLVLLASKTCDAPKPSPEPKYWISHLGADGVPGQYRFPESAALIEQVRQRAGFNINTHWIIRDASGDGRMITGDRHFESTDLPRFLLSEDWPQSHQKQRVEKYIEWIAPSLLTLQNLTLPTRESLEKKLYVQAVSIEYHYHLYSQVIQQKLIKSAQVQSRLQKSTAR